jgi:hypothetical protein
VSRSRTHPQISTDQEAGGQNPSKRAEKSGKSLDEHDLRRRQANKPHRFDVRYLE